MALETATYISDLVATNPAVGDDVSVGDDHIRLLKSTIQATFPNVAGAVTPTHTELNYVEGVTSNIQTQLDTKAPLNSPALTGTPTAPTAAAGTNTTQIATTEFVQTAVGGGAATGAWVELREIPVGGSDATVDFVNGTSGVVLSSTYDEYMIVVRGLKVSADGDVWLRTSTNAGSSYDAGASDYTWFNYYQAVGGTGVDGIGDTADSEIQLAVGLESTSAGLHGYIWFSNPATVANFFVMSQFVFVNDSAALKFQHAYGARLATADVDAIRLLPSTGTFAGGKVALFGRRT